MAIRAGLATLVEMPLPPPSLPERILTILAGALILKVTAMVVANYPDYYPPNFGSDFLRGRERTFPGLYRWAFHTHILAGPVALLLGLILVSNRFRSHFPHWHRRLGWVQVAIVLILVTPSGLVMAGFAAAGPIAGLGLATLAALTAVCVGLGARAAIQRRFGDHRRWMWRCYLLLCSAVVLRMIGGMATVAGVSVPWFDATGHLDQLGRAARAFRGPRVAQTPTMMSSVLVGSNLFMPRDRDHGSTERSRDSVLQESDTPINEGSVHAAHVV